MLWAPAGGRWTHRDGAHLAASEGGVRGRHAVHGVFPAEDRGGGLAPPVPGTFRRCRERADHSAVEITGVPADREVIFENRRQEGWIGKQYGRVSAALDGGWSIMGM